MMMDGYFVVAIDFFMDPIAVKLGNWQWLTGGAYFGVPWGNFVGWFIVTIIVTGVFRVSEYFFSSHKPKFNPTIFIIPVISYGVLAIFYTRSAITLQISNLVWIGSLLMWPQVILNLVLYKLSRPTSASATPTSATR